jgi:hypothetical protein
MLAPYLALAATLLVSLLATDLAQATIHPATVVDGPANDILEVDGAAMAPDGSGGVVYRKQAGGVAHVFAARFVHGRWSAPVQADTSDPFGALQPAIAAGEGGLLLVVWVQLRNVGPRGIPLYELMGASIEPGAAGFGQAIVIDPSVGNVETGDVGDVEPKLAMAPDGAAYVVYRAITNDCFRSSAGPLSNDCPPGNSTDKLVDVRVARYDYLLWSSLGAVNRASQIPMRNPTAANAPAIGVDSINGNGVVAWQEPDSSGTARIFVRRLFGTVQGNVLQASPSTIGGQPVTSDASSPAVAENPEGEARIVYRIQGLAGSAVHTTQLFQNLLPSVVDFQGSKLTAATPVPGAILGGLGVPSAAIDRKGEYRLAWTQAGAVEQATGDEESADSPSEIGVSEGQAFTTINPAGGGTTAWSASAVALPVVAVREDYPQGAFQSAQLSGNVPGAIGGLSLGGDGQGDALLGWTQGPPGASAVVGAFVQAPPAPFQVTTPIGWVRAGGAAISWTASPDAVPGVVYSVYVDGHPRVGGLSGLATRLDASALGDGIHHVQVLASDGAGQQTMSPASELKIDANPPIVKIKRIDRGLGVQVVVRDAASGVDASATRISFGDGRRTVGRKLAAHRYSNAGTYSIVAFVRDKVGNSATVHLRVRAR